MDRKATTKILRQDVLSTLRADGFKNSQGLRAWRYQDRRVDVVEFHFVHKRTAEWNDFLDCSYAFGWGIYLLDVGERHVPRLDSKVRLRPRLDEAHIERSARRAGVWESAALAETFVITPDASTIVGCIEETLEILRTETVRWFESYSSIESIISALRRSDAQQRACDPYTYGPGSTDSFARKRVLAYLLLAEGRFTEATSELEQAYSAIADRPRFSIEGKNRDVHELELIERRIQSARSLGKPSSV